MSRPANLSMSQKQEKDTAKKWGGTQNAGSGNKWQRKNDVRTKDESIECKVTSKGSYSLKLSELLTAEKNALMDGRDMRFKITFADPAGFRGLRPEKSYVVLPEEDYLATTRN